MCRSYAVCDFNLDDYFSFDYQIGTICSGYTVEVVYLYVFFFLTFVSSVLQFKHEGIVIYGLKKSMSESTFDSDG